MPSDARQRMRQNLPQPSEQFRFGGPTKLLPTPMSFEDRLLHDIGLIELAAQPRIQLQPRQQPQIVAVLVKLKHQWRHRLQNSCEVSANQLTPSGAPRVATERAIDANCPSKVRTTALHSFQGSALERKLKRLCLKSERIRNAGNEAEPRPLASPGISECPEDDVRNENGQLWRFA